MDSNKQAITQYDAKKKKSDKLSSFLDIQEKLKNVLKLPRTTLHVEIFISQKLMEMVNPKFFFKIIKYPAG